MSFASECKEKGFCVAQAVLNQKPQNNGNEFRKLKELKKLTRYARLGKLKDNSLEHASEGCRLLTLNSQEDQNLQNTSRKLPHYMLGSGAVKKLLENNLSPSSCATERVLPNTNFQEEKPGKS